jgi:hypothetical protein
MDLQSIIETLREKRPIFYSEADFQFALAWEIQQKYHDADVRLEYPAENQGGKPNAYIDILVWLKERVYPIELKYRTRKLSVTVGDETFALKEQSAQDGGAYNSLKDISRLEMFVLKEQGAQDAGAYNSIKDISRLENFVSSLKENGFECGYALWLTNDSLFWRGPIHKDVSWEEFSIREGEEKSGSMWWIGDPHIGKGYEDPIELKGTYTIAWKEYSDVSKYAGEGSKNTLFRYVLTRVDPASSVGTR